jgi:hypothetical protein
MVMNRLVSYERSFSLRSVEPTVIYLFVLLLVLARPYRKTMQDQDDYDDDDNFSSSTISPVESNQSPYNVQHSRPGKKGVQKQPSLRVISLIS